MLYGMFYGMLGFSENLPLIMLLVGFVSGDSHENFPVGHPSWKCSRLNSLNFGVLMELEASEFSKGRVQYGGGHVHIRHIIPSSLVDVGCYNQPPLGSDDLVGTLTPYCRVCHILVSTPS